MKCHKSCHPSELGKMQNGYTNCEAQRDLSSGAAVPISAIELQYNEHFKCVRICSEMKGQEQFIQLVKKRKEQKKLLPSPVGSGSFTALFSVQF